MSVLRTDFLFAFFNKIVNRVYYANIAVLSTAMTLKLLFLSKLDIQPGSYLFLQGDTVRHKRQGISKNP